MDRGKNHIRDISTVYQQPTVVSGIDRWLSICGVFKLAIGVSLESPILFFPRFGHGSECQELIDHET
jgi:hypothetical protein